MAKIFSISVYKLLVIAFLCFYLNVNSADCQAPKKLDIFKTTGKFHLNKESLDQQSDSESNEEIDDYETNEEIGQSLKQSIIELLMKKIKEMKSSIDKRGFLRSTMKAADRRRPGWELAYGKRSI